MGPDIRRNENTVDGSARLRPWISSASSSSSFSASFSALEIEMMDGSLIVRFVLGLAGVEMYDGDVEDVLDGNRDSDVLVSWYPGILVS